MQPNARKKSHRGISLSVAPCSASDNHRVADESHSMITNNYDTNGQRPERRYPRPSLQRPFPITVYLELQSGTWFPCQTLPQGSGAASDPIRRPAPELIVRRQSSPGCEATLNFADWRVVWFVPLGHSNMYR